MNAQTPVGLEIVSVSKPEHKHTDITAAEYVARLKTDKSVHEVAELFGKFIALDKIEIEKRTKKKTINLVDIKPHITVLDSKELEDSFEVTKGFEMWYNIKAFELPSVLPTRVNATPLNERHDIKAGSPLALQR